MIAQTLIFAVLLLIMWTIVILLVWRDGREKKGTAMKDNDLISRSALLEKAIGVVVYDEGGWDCNVRAVPDDVIEKAPAVDAVEVVRCENCVHQQKVWHSDKRMKEGGFFMYSCELNQDPFVAHVVDGNPGEFCYAGERRADDEP